MQRITFKDVWHRAETELVMGVDEFAPDDNTGAEARWRFDARRNRPAGTIALRSVAIDAPRDIGINAPEGERFAYVHISHAAAHIPDSYGGMLQTRETIIPVYWGVAALNSTAEQIYLGMLDAFGSNPTLDYGYAIQHVVNE